MNIRRATSADAEALSDLVALMGYTAEPMKMRERVEAITAKQDHCLLVAEAEDQVVGFCHGYVRTLVEVDEAIEIGGLAVAEAWQGKGVAKQLITNLEQWTSEQDLKMIVLSSSTMRVQAHGFYEHMGYKKVRQQFAFEKILSATSTK